MIATGLVFLLGALVAILVFLLFVPILWRNAQRLARRDFVATMPATIGEIRAEVDRVRAETAMTVRRHEMAAQSARERAARERAEVGRLTAAHAEMKHHREAFEAEVNALRGDAAAGTQRSHELNETIARLQGENQTLREENEGLRTALRRLETDSEDDEDARTAAKVDALSTSLVATAAPVQPIRVSATLAEASGEELRERIADMAAGLIHRTAVEEGPQSPLASLIEPSSEPDAPAPKRGTPRSLADRVREIAVADVRNGGGDDRRDAGRSPRNGRR